MSRSYSYQPGISASVLHLVSDACCRISSCIATTFCCSRLPGDKSVIAPLVLVHMFAHTGMGLQIPGMACRMASWASPVSALPTNGPHFKSPWGSDYEKLPNWNGQIYVVLMVVDVFHENAGPRRPRWNLQLAAAQCVRIVDPCGRNAARWTGAQDHLTELHLPWRCAQVQSSQLTAPPSAFFVDQDVIVEECN